MSKYEILQMFQKTFVSNAIRINTSILFGTDIGQRNLHTITLIPHMRQAKEKH